MTTTTNKATAHRNAATPEPAPLWTIGEMLERLEPQYGPPEPPRAYDPLSELIYTILSQHTSDANSIRAYDSLRASFSSWEAMAEATPQEVADSIRGGGLAQVKAPRIQGILREVKSRTGGYDLSFLEQMSLDEAKAWLRELPGVGPKTVGCVLMFSLQMPALPVDTHVYRVAKRLGLFDEKVNAEQSHDVLEGLIEPADRLPFHMLTIQHGRVVCKAIRPRCELCVLEERCPGSVLRQAASAMEARAKAGKRGRTSGSTAKRGRSVRGSASKVGRVNK